MANKSKPAFKADVATLAGLALAFAGIVGGLILEGGSVKDISQVTAALIVLGGTLGATMVASPVDLLLGSARRFRALLFTPVLDASSFVEEIVEYAARARKNGIVSLEEDAAGIHDPFLKKAMNLAVDGTDPQEIRTMMELEIGIGEQRAEAEAKVFEAAGGFAPTIGIIGAVMGLIQVMKHLENIEEVGQGIAVAFVATIYGVGIANIFFLPAAAKMKTRAHEEAQIRELIVEGVVSLVEGLNPKLIRSKLEAYVHAVSAPKKEPDAKTVSASVQESAA